MQKDMNSHAMGQYQSTKYHLSSETAQNYGDVINAAAPYLEGYDEIYVITTEDILGTRNTRLSSQHAGTSENLSTMIGHGDLLSRLRRNKDSEQIRTLEQALARFATPTGRSSFGPASLSVETMDKNGAPFRSGFVFLTGPNLKNTFLLPENISESDAAKFASIDSSVADKTTLFVNKIAIAHELGHLVHNIETGIRHLSPKKNEKDITERERERHPQEIAADNFAINIVPFVPGYDDSSSQAILALALKTRTLKGVWSVASTSPRGHFTAPFLPNGPLEGTSYNDILQVSKNLKGTKDQALAELLRQTLEDITYQRPESEQLQACINDAQNMKKELKYHKKKVPPLVDQLKDCVEASYDTRTLIIQKMLSRTPEGTLDHQLLTLYLNADTQLHDILDGKPLPPAPVEEKSTTAPTSRVPFRHFSLESNF